MFFTPPDKSPLSPKYLTDRFCFTNLLLFPLPSVLGHLDVHLFYSFNKYHFPSDREATLGSRDFMNQHDFKKGRCQCFILSNKRLNMYTFNQYIGLSQTPIALSTFSSFHHGQAWVWGPAFTYHCSGKKQKQVTLGPWTDPKPSESRRAVFFSLFQWTQYHRCQVPSTVLFDYSFVLRFSKLGTSLQAFVLSCLGALTPSPPQILVSVSHGSLHS